MRNEWMPFVLLLTLSLASRHVPLSGLAGVAEAQILCTVVAFLDQGLLPL